MLEGMKHKVNNIAVPALLYGTAWKEDRTQELTFLALQRAKGSSRFYRIQLL